MHVLGNDFMLVDAVTQRVYFSAEWICQLADRHRGIGFDQLLVLEPPYDPELDFHYRIFNADGREVSQCGNGACCLAHFVYRQGLTNRPEIRISTQGGRMLLTVLAGNQVQVTLGEPRFEPQQVPFHAYRAEKHYILRIEDQTVLCGVVSVGNPHCVIQVEQCATAPVAQLGLVVSHHERFPQQTNVGFMQIIDSNHIRLRVYERGVGETQACGSGACAAVAVGFCQGLLAEKVRVDLPGGTLQVRWSGPGNPVKLIGSVSHVYDGFLQW